MMVPIKVLKKGRLFGFKVCMISLKERCRVLGF